MAENVAGHKGMDSETCALGRGYLSGVQFVFCICRWPFPAGLTTFLRRPLPGAALFFCPLLALLAGEGPGQIPVPRAAQVLIRRPGHDILAAEQPVQELQLRVAVPL